MKPKYILWLIAGCLLLFDGQVRSQSSSTNYEVVTGGPVSGGGESKSNSFSVLGSAPTGLSGISSSGSFTLSGGITAIAGIDDAIFFYDGESVKTVAKEDIILKVFVQGGVVGASGNLWYHLGGHPGDFVSQTMIQGTGDTLVATVSADMLGPRVVEYYFELSRSGRTELLGDQSNPYLIITNLTNAEGQRPNPLPDTRFRIVGVPLDITGDRRVGTVFGDDLGRYDKTEWRLGRYTADAAGVTENPTEKLIQPGYAYWLIARGARKYGAAGKALLPNRIYNGNDYYATPYAMDEGWNQLANVFPFDIAWSDMLFDDNGTIKASDDAAVVYPDAFGYDRGFAASASIPGWGGVFIWIEKPGVRVLFPYKESLATAPKVEQQPSHAASPTNWQIELKLTAAGLDDRYNFAGVKFDALDGVDCYDQYEPPPPPSAPQLAFLFEGARPELRRCDYRAPFEDGAHWDISLVKMPNRVLLISGLEQIPDGMQAWLIYDFGETISIRDNSEIVVPDDVSSAELVIGTEDYSSKQLSDALPVDYALYQNFPNPFNPSTTIRYGIPSGGHVRLEIFNLLGRRVAMLVNSDQPAGFHTIIWSGRDSYGQAVATGIYFYRIQSGSYTENRKMILLK